MATSNLSTDPLNHHSIARREYVFSSYPTTTYGFPNFFSQAKYPGFNLEPLPSL
jgi:hypothetical protein